MRIVMFGGYDPEYARNRVLREGLARLGVEVDSCRSAARGSPLLRGIRLARQAFSGAGADALLVPEFRHKDVPLGRLVATLRNAALLVDPLVSRYDTKVGDWGTTAVGSLQADHNHRIDRAAMRFADVLLCDTAAHARFFQEEFRVPAARCAIVPVGFDDAVFQPLPEPADGAFEVAFFGSYLPLHGVETIAAAALLLRQEDMRFVLIGQGQTFPTAEAARAAGARLELLPALGPKALAARLQSAHVLLGVFGTSAKAARVVPNKMYQSLALQRAVVTADTPAVREFFTPDVHFRAVPAGDPRALAAALCGLRDDPAARRRLAANGAARVHAAFRPEHIAARLLDAGRTILGWEVGHS